MPQTVIGAILEQHAVAEGIPAINEAIAELENEVAELDAQIAECADEEQRMALEEKKASGAEKRLRNKRMEKERKRPDYKAAKRKFDKLKPEQRKKYTIQKDDETGDWTLAKKDLKTFIHPFDLLQEHVCLQNQGRT